MAYGSYYPQTYLPQYYGTQQMAQNASQMAQAAQQTPATGIIWVQGEAAAKAYPVAAGQSVQLMDSEESVFYIKSTDTSGMPQPLRVFDYTERNNAHNSRLTESKQSDDYVSRKEFEALRDEFRRELRGIKIEGEGEG
jgi:hypothetical protein